MTDFYDKATETEELHREMALKAVRDRRLPNLSGLCLNCNEPTLKGRFCCIECREDWELSFKFRKINGTRED